MKIDKNRSIFLLGGRDLEMFTIKELLLQNGFIEGKNLFDGDLKWGARLSSYAKELSNFDSDDIDDAYGIELIEDIISPVNYHAIDHHNELTNREASIIQVLKLLDLEPSRDQELIATNDVSHIEGMKCICATDEEIVDIRRRDRMIQGVTPEQEKRAKEEIEHIEKRGDIFVLHSGLETFAPVADFCDKRPLLIYNDNALIYYGHIDLLKERYSKEIETKKAFHGRGFFGFDGEYLKAQDTGKIVDQMLNDMPDTFSYHSFMFPFSFGKNGVSDGDLSKYIKIDNNFADRLEGAKWRYKEFDITKDVRRYNEYSYYDEPVREAIYNFQKEFTLGETSYYYTKDVVDGEYNIYVCGEESPYRLKLTDVQLRLFETGIGILVFEVENHKYSNFDNILKINEFGRRVYPQFLDSRCDSYTQGTKNAFLADKIEVKLKKDDEYFTEDYTDIYERNIPEDLIIGKFITEVLGSDLFSQSKDSFCRIKPVLDDRMFVVCYAENETLIECLQSDDDNYKQNDDWYRYLFVDGKSKTVQYAPMQAKLSEESTYPRWLGWGTMWGVTRYSFVALTTRGGRDLILPHTQYVYMQMAIIMLATKASLARFGNEVSRLSNLKDDDKLEEKVQIMYEYYIKFVNKLYFRELTFQDQGIELYRIAKSIMDFDKEIKDLDNEISELHTYISFKHEKNRNDRLETISELGALFLPPTLLAGIYGANIFDFNQTIESISIGLISMLLVALFGFGIIKCKSSAIKIVFGFVAIAIMVGSIFLIDKKPDSIQKDSATKETQLKEKK